MSGKDTVEYEEKLLEGKVLLFSRSGIFQVRLYKGDRRYIYRSLKTRDLKAAREEAVRAYYEVEFRKREQLPLQSKRFADVLNEYVLFRRRQNQRGTHKQSNKRNQQQTSDEMLRQVERVTKFWLEYAGNRLIERVDNSVLRDYVAWRQNYYLRVPEAIPTHLKSIVRAKVLDGEELVKNGSGADVSDPKCWKDDAVGDALTTARLTRRRDATCSRGVL